MCIKSKNYSASCLFDVNLKHTKELKKIFAVLLGIFSLDERVTNEPKDCEASCIIISINFKSGSKSSTDSTGSRRGSCCSVSIFLLFLV